MIDIFLSRPTIIPSDYSAGIDGFNSLLKAAGMQPHTIGVSQYPSEAPLEEVIQLLDSCKGMIVLGVPQIEIVKGAVKGVEITSPLVLATEWNHIEASLAYARNLPMLVIQHHTVSRGIFDRGPWANFSTVLI
jgi:hypothetical protein